MSRTVTFGLVCGKCRKLLTGERIVEVSHPDDWHTFFYTESDHQIAYEGPNRVGVYCLEFHEAEAGGSDYEDDALYQSREQMPVYQSNDLDWELAQAEYRWAHGDYYPL